MRYDVGGAVFSGSHCASQLLSEERGVPHAHSVGGTRLPDPLSLLASQGAQRYRSRLLIQETQVPALVREDALEEGVATHSSIPAWEIPRTEEPGGSQSTGLQRVRHNSFHGDKTSIPSFPRGREFQAGLKVGAWSVCLHLGLPPTLKAEGARLVPSHPSSGWRLPGWAKRDFALGRVTPQPLRSCSLKVSN